MTCSKPFAIDSALLSTIEEDATHDLTGVEGVLKSIGVETSTQEERKFGLLRGVSYLMSLVKDVCHIVAVRAARLSAVLICALLKHTEQDQPDNKDEMVVAVDGSVFEKFPGFPRMMTESVVEILGREAVKFVLAKEGSGYGAALASII